MKKDLIALWIGFFKTMGLGLIMVIVVAVATFVKLAADVTSLISNEISTAATGRLEKLTF